MRIERKGVVIFKRKMGRKWGSGRYLPFMCVFNSNSM